LHIELLGARRAGDGNRVGLGDRANGHSPEMGTQARDRPPTMLRLTGGWADVPAMHGMGELGMTLGCRADGWEPAVRWPFQRMRMARQSVRRSAFPARGR
jgi:hypothetical protein